MTKQKYKIFHLPEYYHCITDIETIGKNVFQSS